MVSNFAYIFAYLLFIVLLLYAVHQNSEIEELKEKLKRKKYARS